MHRVNTFSLNGYTKNILSLPGTLGTVLQSLQRAGFFWRVSFFLSFFSDLGGLLLLLCGGFWES